MFCREQVVQLHLAEAKIEAAGGTLHVIGNGAPMFMAGFREATGYRGALYTDPSLAVYRAAALKRGLGTVLGVRVAVHAIRSYRAGFRQGKTQGDALQQGGVLVISAAGELRYHHISDEAGDHPPVTEILSAIAGRPRLG